MSVFVILLRFRFFLNITRAPTTVQSSEYVPHHSTPLLFALKSSETKKKRVIHIVTYALYKTGLSISTTHQTFNETKRSDKMIQPFEVSTEHSYNNTIPQS